MEEQHEPTKVFLVGVDSPEELPDGISAEDSLDELELLVGTWGGKVAGRVIQARPHPDPAWFLGRGKLEELEEAARRAGAEYVVADSELTPVQLRNMERALDLGVLDRTQIILGIFARRAHSREGKLQVELAQAVYALPRLTGRGLAMSRIGAGAGLRARGPGETKLEVDRRVLRDRIAILRREIAEVGRQREVQARARRESLLPLASLVGYTNAGKSTLFNRLTGADVLVEDKLFATLDPVVRRVDLPGNQRMLLSDTVGFIRKLPHHLVAAFRATLEEVREADILVHVIDASNPAWPDYARAAEEVLRDLDVMATPMVYVLNKVDRLAGGAAEALGTPEARELARRARVVALSALTGEGTGDLLAALTGEVAGRCRVFTLKIPYGRSNLLTTVHERGRILEKDYVEDGVRIVAELDTVVGRRILAALQAADGHDGGG